MPGRALSSASLAVLRSSLSSLAAAAAGFDLANETEGAPKTISSATAMAERILRTCEPPEVGQALLKSQRLRHLLALASERFLIGLHLRGVALGELDRR